jgi:hypothetical protein
MSIPISSSTLITEVPNTAFEPFVAGERYRCTERLGASADAETFLAIEQHEEQTVVLKRFSLQRTHSWKRVELVERELRVLRRLQHELLPTYIDEFEEQGWLYAVLTHVPGEDLRTARQRGRRFTEREIWSLFEDAATAFEYLHGQLPPIVHRDLKPSNILLGPDGRFRIVDFGAVAERLRPEGGSTVVGTFGYMAPEQFQGRASIASDLYALGATALALLTGREPEELPHSGLQIDVESALGAVVSPRLRALLHALLEPNPEARPSDLRALLVHGVPQPATSSAARARFAPASEGAASYAILLFKLVAYPFAYFLSSLFVPFSVAGEALRAGRVLIFALIVHDIIAYGLRWQGRRSAARRPNATRAGLGARESGGALPVATSHQFAGEDRPALTMPLFKAAAYPVASIGSCTLLQFDRPGWSLLTVGLLIVSVVAHDFFAERRRSAPAPWR